MSKEQDLAAYWKRQVLSVEDEYKRWFERGKRISQRYRDEREKIDDERRHFNLFWSNVQTLKPAIYSRVPVPICERRFLDKDPTGRIAATILERALRYESLCADLITLLDVPEPTTLCQDVDRSGLDTIPNSENP